MLQSPTPSSRRLRIIGALVIPLIVALSQFAVPVAAIAQTDPSPSPSETVTPTPDPSPSETVTPTPDPSPSPSETATPSPDPSPTSPPPTIPSEPPTLSSDQPDYPAGALVTLTGTNWVPGEIVHIRVNDDQGQVWIHEVDVIADEDGVITDSFNLPEQFVAVYRAVASTPDGRTATTTFTDAARPDLDQCQNGSLSNPSTSACSAANANDWARGNLTESKAHYLEGDSIPQRLIASGADAGSQYFVTLDYDTTKSAKHAFDYLTTYNRTVSTAAPCAGVTGCSGSPATAAIPNNDPNIPFPYTTGVFSIWNATINSVAFQGVTSGSYAGDSTTSIKVTFTVTGSTGTKNVVLAWGAHIATRADWGVNNSAVAISGSPYHVSMGAVSSNFGNQGNRDLQTAAAAVIFPGSVTIVKHASPEGSTAFAFTASPSPLSNFSLTDTSASSDPSKEFPGITNFQSYTVTETVPSGWSLATIVCTVTSPNGGAQTVNKPAVSINLKEGENVTCTFSNERQQATLTVIKHVENDNGGSAVASDWQIHVKSGVNDVAGSPKSGKESPGDAYTLSAGTYSVSEAGGPSGYTATFSGACDNGGSVTLALGDELTCTITNDDQGATLTVIKHVINDDGGDATAGDWSLHVQSGGNDVAGSPKAGSEQGDTYTLGKGTYAVSETGGPSGYSQSFSGDCDNGGSVTLALGDELTCTITNDDQPGSLVVIKEVTNDNGGNKEAGDFEITVTGGNPSPATFPGEADPGTEVSVDAGNYSVDEGNHDGYTKSLSGGCSGTIANGETKTCTITNDDIAPKLTVIKHVENNDGGTASAGAWSIHVKSGSSDVAGSPKPGSENGDTYTLDAGSYTVSEAGGPQGYTFVGFSDDCSASGTVTLQVGETKSCTLTNKDQPRLIVIKKVVNDNGGSATASQFTIKVTGGNPNPSSFPGSESGTTVRVDPGTYGVTEEQPEFEWIGYRSTFSADCTGEIQDGQSKTCTVTNNDFRLRKTPGYWKNHKTQATALLPIKLGNYTVDTFTKATAVFNKMNCSSTQANDALGCLAGHLLASKLNVKKGTEQQCISAAITAADNFLKGLSVTYGGKTATGVTYTGPSSTYRLTTQQRSLAVAIKNDLDKYNNNVGCP